jgi:hypothetical protein
MWWGNQLGRRRGLVDPTAPLTTQVKGIELRLDPECGAILLHHPTLLCLEIQDPSGMARLLAEPVKGKLPIGG